VGADQGTRREPAKDDESGVHGIVRNPDDNEAGQERRYHVHEEHEHTKPAFAHHVLLEVVVDTDRLFLWAARHRERRVRTLPSLAKRLERYRRINEQEKRHDTEEDYTTFARGGVRRCHLLPRCNAGATK